MPIVVSHQPAYNVVGETVYRGGLMGGAAQRRSEVEAQQMQYDQMANNRYSQMLNIWSQQQAQNAAAQRQGMQNVFDAQMQAQQNAQQMAMYQQEQANRLRLMEQEHAYNMEGYQQRADIGLMTSATEMRGSLETALGGIDESRFSDAGRSVWTGIQNDLNAIDAQVKAGSIRPSDYYHAMSEIQGRAAALQSPRMYAPVTNPQDILNQSRVVDPATGLIYDYNPATGAMTNTKTYASINGQEVNKPFVMQNGSIGVYNSKGELDVQWDSAKAYDETMQQVDDQMVKELQAFKRNGGGGGVAAPPGMDPETAQKLGFGGTGVPSADGNLPSWISNPAGIDERTGLSNWESERTRRFESRWAAKRRNAHNGLNASDDPSPSREMLEKTMPKPQTTFRQPRLGETSPFRQEGASGAAPTPEQTASDQLQQQTGRQPTPSEVDARVRGNQALEQAGIPTSRNPGQQPAAMNQPSAERQTSREKMDALRARFSGDPAKIRAIDEIEGLVAKYPPGTPTERWSNYDQQEFRRLLATIAGAQANAGSIPANR